jgi:hypothetical protein
MPLPEIIPVRYAEDEAGFMSMSPVVDQPFRLSELADMVVSVVGKDSEKVRQVFQTGTVLYNGYRYRWQPVDAENAEIEKLIAHLPEDDPSRPFEASKVTAILFESGGGTQRNLVEITQKEAGEKKLLGRNSPWDVLRSFAESSPPHYEKYSNARKADLYRVTLAFEGGQELLTDMLEAAPRALKHRWNTLRPPSVLTFVCPR